ncbi:MAG: DUF47 family protein [Polyangia bacterium]|jgi:predicted phosphate transport protein (TIGR00153 family)|nr:DUF47 family protein [Polyangia bacterium]
MLKSLIPRDDLFFDQFEKMGKLMVQAMEALISLLKCEGDYTEHARRVKTIESECDEVVHSAIDHLHRTFVTPLDRQDIRKLMVRLDDIVDLTEAVSSRIAIYKPKVMRPEALKLAEVSLESVKQVAAMLGELRQMSKRHERIKELAVEVNRLENAADDIRREAMALLFAEGGDVLEVLKWKDILEHLEAVTDRCEDASDILEGIALENT